MENVAVDSRMFAIVLIYAEQTGPAGISSFFILHLCVLWSPETKCETEKQKYSTDLFKSQGRMDQVEQFKLHRLKMFFTWQD